jgi:hypothetical protein
MGIFKKEGKVLGWPLVDYLGRTPIFEQGGFPRPLVIRIHFSEGWHAALIQNIDDWNRVTGGYWELFNKTSGSSGLKHNIYKNMWRLDYMIYAGDILAGGWTEGFKKLYPGAYTESKDGIIKAKEDLILISEEEAKKRLHDKSMGH